MFSYVLGKCFVFKEAGDFGGAVVGKVVGWTPQGTLGTLLTSGRTLTEETYVKECMYTFGCASARPGWLP